ncbi:piggyBac transposable element-derived protein 4 [Trichonephila clavipes]|nr:piggyBac transposable element-derived protein 4 [Trichonephila clavipes]
MRILIPALVLCYCSQPSDYDICKSGRKDGTIEKVPCPKAIAVYNDVMEEVDRIGQRKERYKIKKQVNKRNRSLDQLIFRIALARQLIDGYSSRKRKGRPDSFQAKECAFPDDVRLASVGNHMPKMVSNYRWCKECNKGTRKEAPLHVCRM